MGIKENIMTCAFNLFKCRGIKSVSMDNIALELGASKKTIYKWFENKDEIVEAALETYLTDMNLHCSQFSNQSANAIEELFNVMGMIRQKMASIHPSIFSDLQKYHPKAYQLWVQHKNQVIYQNIVNNLKRGISEQLYRADLNIEIMARLRLLQTEHGFNPEFFTPGEYDLQQVQLAILEHYMLGITTLKGHKLINKLKKINEEDW